VKVLRVMAPMPEVAPTKTATRCEGRLVEIRELECWILERETIVQSGVFMELLLCWALAIIFYIYASASCIESTRFQF
jgi:hypothetical protein